MPADDLWYLMDSFEFAESLDSGQVVALPRETLLYRAVYVGDARGMADNLDLARERLTTCDFQSRNDIYLQRPTVSSDGPPRRTIFMYRVVEYLDVQRIIDERVPYAQLPRRVGVKATRAARYEAIRMGSSFAWENGHAVGREAYFLTGIAGTALWRLARLEPDALNRQVLTLDPVRLPYGLAVPNFDSVANAGDRAYLTEKFEAFERAVATGAHFDTIDRASNVAHAVVGYCLAEIERPVHDTFGERLREARTVLDNRDLRSRFRLTDFAYHLAHKIRLLHAFGHPDQVASRGRSIRPEVGLGIASDLSEFLVETCLARY